MPQEWVTYLSALVRAACGRLSQQPVDHSEAAAALIREFAQECRDEKLNAGRDPAQRQLWVRAYEKVIRLAALLAVADNYLFPVVQVEHVEWAIGMLRHANLTVQRRVCDGDISDDADHAREQMILQRCRRWLAVQRKDPKEEGCASTAWSRAASCNKRSAHETCSRSTALALRRSLTTRYEESGREWLSGENPPRPRLGRNFTRVRNAGAWWSWASVSWWAANRQHTRRNFDASHPRPVCCKTPLVSDTSAHSDDRDRSYRRT